ncbi:3-deoxy-manno-octulosonate cytidylyltransferase [Acetobacteraceae bacterium]|nr:3-deoxy-manno-octulosonate cytidylyltransferase [Acetobacteraceae bacterium]
MLPVVCIPARMNSSRLPKKMLADIGGKPMIVHLVENIAKDSVYPIFVATDHLDILAVLSGIQNISTVMTKDTYESGSDRICALLQEVDPQKKFDVIINLQGDMPFVSSSLILEVLKSLEEKDTDLGTLVAPLSVDFVHEKSRVKVACGFRDNQKNTRALYFSRNVIPHGQEFWEHIGIYAWRRNSLERFVKEQPTVLEKQERLEQLRALESGMKVVCRRIKEAPIAVDVAQDLERARLIFAQKKDT